VLASIVPAKSMPGVVSRVVIWSCRTLPWAAVRASEVEVLLTPLKSWTAPEAVVEEAAMLTTGAVPAVTAIGPVPVTAVTGAAPEEAAVRRPFASTVSEVLV